MSDSMKIQPAASRSVHSIAATDANDSRVNLITATPSTPTTSEVRAPASERAARFAELEIHTENQRDRLVTARKTQEFLHHDRESGISYHLIDGTLVQGSFRGGAPASGKARDSAADDGLSSLQIQRALSEQSDAEELAADVSRRQHAGDDDLLKNMSA